MFVIFVIAMYSGYQYLSSSATIPAALASVNYQNTTVYYSDGKTVLGTFGATNRQDLTYAQIPQQLQNAVVAAEDKSFWTEGGISPTGILRAAIHDVTSSGGNKNGGSTITQEFVRGYYDGVGTQQTASRKIKEIFIAQKVASQYSKQWILTNYLNLIYLGENSYGVAAAAQTYFGEPVSQLTVAQDAVIAGVIQQPSTYPLLSNRAALKARWTYVLQQMVKDNYITQAQMSTMTFPKLLTDHAGGAASGTSIMANNRDPWAPYIMQQVEDELTSSSGGVSQQELETGGLKIVTTISRSMEQQLYKAVSENLNSQSISNTSGATVTSLPSWALVGAELQNPKNGEIIAEYPGKGQNLSAKACVAADCDINTAAYAREQVGSSFKPYVLSTAVNQGMNVQSSVLDTSPYICIAPDASSEYSVPLTGSVYTADNQSNSCLLPGGAPVENDGGETIGKQVGQQSSGANKGAAYWSSNVQNALAQSSNTAFTDLAHKVGTENIINTAQEVGVNMAPYPTGSGLASYKNQVGLALGIAPLTVQEQTSMLSTIADNGLYHQAHLIKFWQQGADGAEQMLKIDQRSVLQPEPGRGRSVRDGADDHQRYGGSDGHLRPATGRHGHWQDRYDDRLQVGLLHRRDLAVLAGGRHVHAEPEGKQQPGRAGRRRFRWLLAGEDLEHVRRGGVLVDAAALPDEPGLLRHGMEPARPGAQGSEEGQLHRDVQWPDGLDCREGLPNAEVEELHIRLEGQLGLRQRDRKRERQWQRKRQREQPDADCHLPVPG